MKKWYQLIPAYLYSQIYVLLTAVMGLVLFAVIFFLYDLPWTPLFYGILLWVFFLGLILVGRFARVWKQYHEIQQLNQRIDSEWDHLPRPVRPLEEVRWESVTELGKRYNEIVTLRETEKQDSLDYYTTWVHQIKTPIAVMQMLIQSEDTEMNRALSAELFRIQQYVDMVLTYIRLGSREKDFVFGKYPLDELVRQSIRKYAPQFIRRKLSLNVTTAQVSVLTDEKWLSFILEQLLSNAVKYTYQGGVTITITEDRKVIIADTGIGIAAEDLPRIFEKGFTGYNGRADKKATGLGLYLVKQAADPLGIRISVESEPGKGTAFTLDLSGRELDVE